jgi:hypothetical protein
MPARSTKSCIAQQPRVQTVADGVGVGVGVLHPRVHVVAVAVGVPVGTGVLQSRVHEAAVVKVKLAETRSLPAASRLTTA